MSVVPALFVPETLGNQCVIRGDTPGLYSGWAIDSRKIEPGQIFVALPGAQKDGHHFIETALARGAKGILCRQDWTGPTRDGVTFFHVEDVLTAFQSLAKAWRSQLTCPVLAVAGSVGKTTTKEMTRALLRGAWDRVYATKGSENGFLGIPLTILNTPRDAQALVVEIGIDAPGAMAQHLEMVRPLAGIVTAIAPEHLEQLGDMDTVAREESLCLRWIASRGGTAVINADDPLLRPLRASLRDGHLIAYGLEGSPEALELSGRVLAHHQEAEDVEGLETLTIQGLGLKDLTLKVPLPGRHNARNLLGAVALARQLGLTDQDLVRGLKTFAPAEGRSVLKELPQGGLVLCDFYNASPASMAAAFATTATLGQRRRGRLIACLGDMLELGTDEEAMHRDLATGIVNHGFHMVLTVGPRMGWLEDELKQRHFAGTVRRYQDPEALAQSLSQDLRSSDVLLIKGSRSMAMERAFHKLRGD